MLSAVETLLARSADTSPVGPIVAAVFERPLRRKMTVSCGWTSVLRGPIDGEALRLFNVGPDSAQAVSKRAP